MNYKKFTNNELIEELQNLSKEHDVTKEILLFYLDKMQSNENQLKEIENKYKVVIDELENRKMLKK